MIERTRSYKLVASEESWAAVNEELIEEDWIVDDKIVETALNGPSPLSSEA